MTGSIEDYINYRIQKSIETYEDATILVPCPKNFIKDFGKLKYF